MVACGCRLIFIGCCQAADLDRHQTEGPSARGSATSYRRPPQADIQRLKSGCCRLRAAIRVRTSHPHHGPAN